MPWLVRNDLPIPVIVRPFDIDPYDWMGDANPGRLEGKVLQPGTQEVVILANNCSANGAPFGLRFEQEWNGGTSEITRPSFDKEYLCMAGPIPVVCGVPLATRVRVGWGYRGGPDDANFGCLKSGSTARFTYHKWGDDGSEQVWNGHGQLTGCGGFRLVPGPPPD